MNIIDTTTFEAMPQSLQDLCCSTSDIFAEQYKNAPIYMVSAPGRVNMIGEHIDYNDGFVLPMAIERHVVIAASPREDSAKSIATFASVTMNESISIPLDTPLTPATQGWSMYLEGVIAGFQRLGVAIPSFDAVIKSNVPLGGGLSSSAALEVALATLLEVLTGHALADTDKALLCQHAEHEFAGVPCGIMDQFSSVFGRPNELMLLDCHSQNIKAVSFDDPAISVLITNSNVKHALMDGEYAKRRAECDAALVKLGQKTWRDVTMEELSSKEEVVSPIEFRRACHVVSEINRCLQAAEAFASGDWSSVGTLMYASHDSLRDEYEVSCKELDILVGIARELGTSKGIFGSRMTGGGFGGCTVTLIATQHIENIQHEINAQYESETGITPTSFTSRPAQGAQVIVR